MIFHQVQYHETPGPRFELGNRLRETGLANLRRNRWAIRACNMMKLKEFKGFYYHIFHFNSGRIYVVNKVVRPNEIVPQAISIKAIFKVNFSRIA